MLACNKSRARGDPLAQAVPLTLSEEARTAGPVATDSRAMAVAIALLLDAKVDEDNVRTDEFSGY